MFFLLLLPFDDGFFPGKTPGKKQVAHICLLNVKCARERLSLHSLKVTINVCIAFWSIFYLFAWNMSKATHWNEVAENYKKEKNMVYSLNYLQIQSARMIIAVIDNCVHSMPIFFCAVVGNYTYSAKALMPWIQDDIFDLRGEKCTSHCDSRMCGCARAKKNYAHLQWL